MIVTQKSSAFSMQQQRIRHPQYHSERREAMRSLREPQNDIEGSMHRNLDRIAKMFYGSFYLSVLFSNAR